MEAGPKLISSAPTAHRAAFRSAAAIEAELISLIDRMKVEVSEQSRVTEASANELHDLRLRAERFLVSMECPKSVAETDD